MPICSLKQLYQESKHKSAARISKNKTRIVEYKASDRIKPLKLYTRNSYERKCLHEFAEELGGLVHQKWIDRKGCTAKMDMSQCTARPLPYQSEYCWTNIAIDGPIRREPAIYLQISKKV